MLSIFSTSSSSHLRWSYDFSLRPPAADSHLSLFARATTLPLNAIISHISHIAFLLFSPKQRCRFFSSENFNVKRRRSSFSACLRFELNTCEIMSENSGEDVERSQSLARTQKPFNHKWDGKENIHIFLQASQWIIKLKNSSECVQSSLTLSLHMPCAMDLMYFSN